MLILIAYYAYSVIVTTRCARSNGLCVYYVVRVCTWCAGVYSHPCRLLLVRSLDLDLFGVLDLDT
jgi:hypothetical protein